MVHQDVGLLSDFMSRLFGEGISRAIPLIERAVDKDVLDCAGTMLRLAALYPDGSSLEYMRLYNLWQNMGCPSLKPNAAQKSILLLTDFTADNIPPLLRLFCVARGIDADVQLPVFDSVEQQALDPGSSLYREKHDSVILCLSEHWLRRYFGSEAMVKRADVEKACRSLGSIIRAIETNSGADLLVGNFVGQANPTPGGMVTGTDGIGRRLAVMEVNTWLASQTSQRVHVLDLETAIFLAGGASALGNISYLRAKIAFEPSGMLAVAREFASGVACICGKTHRAVVTDWDNTLWGGEVAEAGALGVTCGHDSPDGLGYRMVQQYLRGLKSLGVVLASASRNEQSVQSIFSENPDMVLTIDDFASIQVDYTPKSEAIGRISEDLGFGAEYMVFIDDSLFEIAEAVAAHPYLDVIQAGPGPDQTLRSLAQARIGNALFLSEADIERADRLGAIKKQRRMQASAGTIEEFLESIDIQLTFTPFNEGNRQRILQMFQKTNQFNLTTRRHLEADLARLRDAGAEIVAVSYEDSFAPQGIISVIVLLSEERHVRIESWVMSCRVLNRTVEQAVLAWILDHTGGRDILGEYIPTEKNGLVRDMYKGFGFERVGGEETTGREYWLCSLDGASRLPPRHFAQMDDYVKDKL
jgi:FkbH-like protein